MQAREIIEILKRYHPHTKVYAYSKSGKIGKNITIHSSKNKEGKEVLILQENENILRGACMAGEPIIDDPLLQEIGSV